MNHISDKYFYEIYDASGSDTIGVRHYSESSFFLALTRSNLETRGLLKELLEDVQQRDGKCSLFEFAKSSKIIKNSDFFEGVIIQFDFEGGFFSHLNFGFPPICLKTPDGKLIELEPSSMGTQNKILKNDVQSFWLEDVSVLYAASSNLGTLMFKNIRKEVFSKKDVLNHISDIGENLLQKEGLFSFFLINCEIDKNIEYTRNYKIAPRLQSAREIESELERLMEEFFRDQSISAKASLVLNELLLNSYEHGILGINSEEKHKMMEQGDYDAYLLEREKGVDGEIVIDATFYAKGLLRIGIKDSGCGFDYDKYLKNEKSTLDYSGRGIQMSKNLANAIFFRDGGRDVIFFIRYDEKSIMKEMSEFTEKELLSECSALYVEDEPVIRSLFEGFLKKRLKIVYVASDGLDGLEQFKKYKPDLVISDVSMPHLNGLEMVKSIKAIAPNTPVILTTAHDYEANIYEAVKIGVNKFLAKPIELESLRSALFAISKKVVLKKQESKKERELSLSDLRAANKYQLSQHEKAGEKQKLLIHSDIQFIDRLSAYVIYKPLEFLSGDMYGIFRISEGVTLFYIVDCMDKGLVASVTSVLSSAFLLENIKQVILGGELSLLDLVNGYEAYIERYLLDDECISVSFLKLDTNEMMLEYVGSGMYPLLLKNRSNGSVLTIKSQNPPFMRGDRTGETVIKELPRDFVILLYSDGVCEFEDFTYKDLLDFAQNSDGYEAFNEKISGFLAQKRDELLDDVTFIYVQGKD